MKKSNKIILNILGSLVLTAMVVFFNYDETKEYYESGELKSKKINFFSWGLGYVYFKSGNVQIQCEYKDKIIEGPYKTYYESGQLESEVNYVNGIPLGIEHNYSESGEYNRKAEYFKDGTHKVYFPSGNIEFEFIPIENNFKLYRAYHESGQLQYKVKMSEDHLRIGLASEYSESGDIILQELWDGKGRERKKHCKTIFDSNAQPPIDLRSQYADDLAEWDKKLKELETHLK